MAFANKEAKWDLKGLCCWVCVVCGLELMMSNTTKDFAWKRKIRGGSQEVNDLF